MSTARSDDFGELDPEDIDPLEAQVGDWLTVSETANLLRTSPNRVRQMVRENALAMLRTGGSREPRVPALMVKDGQVVKGLGGTLTLLADAGYDTREALGWLFSPDDALPGRPIDALRAHRVHEVHRIAQALGF
jgi:excisionase family DNA binding protein